MELDYGVCRLALVSVRKEPGDHAAQITQLLFGDHYEVRSMTHDKHWLMINVITDGSEGWIDAKQHHSISPEYLEQINQADFKITLDLTATLLYKKSPLTIVMGSIVPISTSELFKVEEQLAFNGETKGLNQRRDFEFLKAIAQKYVNAPHQSGGRSPFGIDAGGLVQMIFKMNGYTVPRNSIQQALHGKKVKSLEESLPGDVAIFSTGDSKASHSGILLGDDKIIHSSGQVRIDHVNEEGILNSGTKVYTHHLIGIRRVLASN